MRLRAIAIHGDAAEQLDTLLVAFLADAGATAALLLDRGGQPLATTGPVPGPDAASVGALAAGAFASTGALARLLGEPEFTSLFHEGAHERLHVSAVDEDTLLLALFDVRTTAGMVRLFARETARAIARLLEDQRLRPRRIGALAAPMTDDEARQAIGHRPA
ncbi:MAG: roadblock/LC7 domain-containing protein [Candidatus Rokuibacteriota bacterium]